MNQGKRKFKIVKMRIKLLSYIFVVLTGQLTLSSCSPDKDGELLEIKPADIVLNVSSEKDIIITSNTFWTISCDVSWISFSSKSGIGDGEVKVWATESNPSVDERKGTITVESESITRHISVIQTGTSVLSKPIIQSYIVNGVSFNMVLVEGGTFMMGATDEQGEEYNDDEKPVHQVTLSNYFIGETEVTQELWQAVMYNQNPSHFSGAKYPVESVLDTSDFIAKLSQMLNKDFRLPTEAEWEYAARGGKNSKGFKYVGSNTIADVAWYCMNSFFVGNGNPNYGTHVVANKLPNELGLYDMSGNVWEWCQDFWSPYSSTPLTNPISESGNYRVMRGGAWDSLEKHCRVSSRDHFAFGLDFATVGFRLALTPYE